MNQILKGKGLDGFSSVSVPYVTNAGLPARKDHETTVDTKQYMSDVGSHRFIADTTHAGISYIVGVLDMHLHNPSKKHVDTLKIIYQYLSSRPDDGPVYEKKARSNLRVTPTVTMRGVKTRSNRYQAVC